MNKIFNYIESEVNFLKNKLKELEDEQKNLKDTLKDKNYWNKKIKKQINILTQALEILKSKTNE